MLGAGDQDRQSVGEGAERAAACRGNWVIQGAEACLRRLGTDFIDILYLHKEDHATPLEDTVRALAELVRAGKIRHFGVSNYRCWRIAEICRLCDEAASTGRWSASPTTTP